jgi:uncharacterized protein YyaL (SSP411 family)
MNTLDKEKSPYLLQHASNPIHWTTWNDDALERAKAEDKPIFISIGYATCHWCHVMEKESFSNQELADYFNKNFICIKVDREERPDLDHIYMKACQAITGQGGWPLNCFLTPEGAPFFASTYLPLEDAFERPGLKRLGNAIQDLWTNKRDDLVKDSKNLTEGLLNAIPQKKEDDVFPVAGSLEDCAVELESRYDVKDGGFDQAPKFPNVPNHLFLAYRYAFREDGMKDTILNHSLHQMATGGLFDHIGGGFMRYSTDSDWQIPHFEKMLCDNAMMLNLYSEVFVLKDMPLYKWIAENTAMYLLRDLRATEGAFYSAEDADSEGVEGKFYTWDYQELQDVLGKDFIQFNSTFKLTEEGNFKDPHSNEPMGNHLVWNEFFIKIIRMNQVEPLYELEKFYEPLRQHRNKRPRPFRDEKILTDWNSLLMMSFARSGRLLNEYHWVETAESIFYFLETKMVQGEYLYHRYYEGEVGIKSCLDDYAFFIWGLIELHQSTGNNKYLAKAIDWTNKTIEYFFNSEKGLFHFTLEQQTDLLIRPTEIYDSSLPSGNSVMANNLVRLFQLSGISEFKTVVENLFISMSPSIKEHSSSHCMLMLALDQYYLESPQVSLYNLDLKEQEDKEKFLEELSDFHQLKNPRILFQFPDDKHPSLRDDMAEVKTTQKFERYSLCMNKTCYPATSDLDLIKDMISGKF